MLLTTLTLSQMGHALAVRSRESLLRVELLPNKSLLAADLQTSMLEMAVIHADSLRNLCKPDALSAVRLVLGPAHSAGVLWGVELGAGRMRQDGARP